MINSELFKEIYKKYEKESENSFLIISELSQYLDDDYTSLGEHITWCLNNIASIYDINQPYVDEIIEDENKQTILRRCFNQLDTFMKYFALSQEGQEYHKLYKALYLDTPNKVARRENKYRKIFLDILFSYILRAMYMYERPVFRFLTPYFLGFE